MISYAYDDRIGKKFTFNGLLKRRLIRLHPMVIMGGTDWDCCILHTGTYAMEWNTGAISYHNRLVIARAVFLYLSFLKVYMMFVVMEKCFRLMVPVGHYSLNILPI